MSKKNVHTSDKNNLLLKNGKRHLSLQQISLFFFPMENGLVSMPMAAD